MSIRETWGIVATVKAPAKTILNFVAYHLDLGADRVFVCLDDDNKEAFDALRAHPKVTCTINDKDFWIEKFGRQPAKHQVRQTRNASRIYRQAKSVDWLFHIDVDEFLCPKADLGETLAQLPSDCLVVRVPPCESLCIEDQNPSDKDTVLCKARPQSRNLEKSLQPELYPKYHGVLASGFISHTQGKIGVRTGLKKIRFGIHRAFQNEDQALSDIRTDQIELCHKHVESWDKWLKIMEFRLTKGSYREELTQNLRQGAALTFHQLFRGLTADGNTELREFFEEVCLATPELCDRLANHGLLRRFALDLEAKCARQFPEYAD